MTPTLFLIADNLDIRSDYGIDLINKVDTFYNSAWNKLTLIGTMSFAVIGLLVPFVIQWYQKKSLKVSEELMKKEMENQSMRLKSELLENLNNSLEERLAEFKKQIEEFNASITGKTFHLQANSQLNDGIYGEALADYIIAAQHYLVVNDHTNLQTVLSVIKDRCLPMLSEEEINDIHIVNEFDLNGLLDDLNKLDEKGAFTTLVREIKLALTKLPKTKLG